MTAATHRFAAMWPIEDDQRTLTDLVTEARPDLDTWMRQKRATAVGIPEWAAIEHAGHPFLTVVVPAVPMEAERQQ